MFFIPSYRNIALGAIVVLAGLKMLAGDMSYAYVQKTDNECVMGMGPDTTAIYDRLFLDAVLARQKGNDTEAFELFRSCTEINPKAAEAQFYLAQYYLNLNDKVKAMACFRNAATLEPDNSTFTETLAKMYVSSAHYKDAIDVYEKLFAADDSRIDVLDMLFRLYQIENNLDMALQTLERMEVLEDKNEQLTLAKIEILTSQGKKEIAISETKQLAERYPGDLNYKGLYGDILLQNDEDEAALKVFNEILTEEPNNNRAQLSLRSYFMKHQALEKADSMTMRILLNKNTSTEDREYMLRQLISEEGNGNVDSIKILASFNAIQQSECRSPETGLLQAAYMSMKNMAKDSVARVLEDVLAIAPDNASASLQLIGQAWEADDMDRVLKLATSSSQYNPEEMAFYYFEGMALFRKDDNDGALNAFRKGVSVITDKSNPDIVSDFYSVIGDLYYQKGMQHEAYAAYDSCLQWKPDNMGCLNNYAYYLSETGGDLEKAEAMSYKTVKAEPKNATYLDTYAWVLFGLGRYTEAKVYIEQALQNDTESSSHVLFEHAGDICIHAGYTDKALEYWEEALKLNPGDKTLHKKIKHKKYFRQ